jgi:DNA-binding SARP family transcriptional activator
MIYRSTHGAGLDCTPSRLVARIVLGRRRIVTDSFRHGAPRPRAEWIDRPRLIERLARRFEVRALLIVAPAGYGKTTILTQAIEAARPDESRHDVWVQCAVGDAHAPALTEAILLAAGLGRPNGPLDDARTIADALMRFAPRQVCLILDDVHVMAPGSGGLGLLDQLLEVLPANAHLLLSGRTMPTLQVAKLRVEGRCDVVGTDEMQYDADERQRAIAEHERLGDAASWPAMTFLSRSGSVGDSVPYLLEEVAADLGTDRRSVLAALSLLRQVDDDALRVVASTFPTARELLADLPLVQVGEDGSFQLHDLWREALTEPSRMPPEAADLVVALADDALTRERFVVAAELYAHVGSLDGLRRTARAVLLHPLTSLAVPNMRRVRDVCVGALGPEPLTELFDASVLERRDERASSEAFEAVAISARSMGDDDVEALALYNAMNMRSIVDPATIPGWVLERAEALSESGDHVAELVATTTRSHRARLTGDPESAAMHLRGLSRNPASLALPTQAFGFGDLGRPEDVLTPPDVDEAATLASQGGNQYLAQALWLRGEVSPELALEFGRRLAADADDMQMAHVGVSTNAVLAIVAVAAGSLAEAHRFMARSQRWAPRTVSDHVLALAGMARASIALDEATEEEATTIVAEVLADQPIVHWPQRPYLYALPMVYVLAPDTRAVLSRCRFGPAFMVALQAGQALVALREAQDPSVAADLPWHEPLVLRAHVAPSHLAELAAGAATAGADVGVLLQQLPDLRAKLLRVVGAAHAPTAGWAGDTVDRLPARPPYDISVGLLGPVTLHRGDTWVTEAPWVKRERVRELLALLLLTGGMSRVRAAELVWASLPRDKALANLRVNLAHLQKILQPGRGDTSPWFVQATAEMLSLAPAGIRSDLADFETAAADARLLDGEGQTRRAIELYRAAAALHRGGLLEDLPHAAWADADRSRVQALATGVLSRLGELVLACGEPEEAASWASRTLQMEPLHERAGRLLVRALAGQDDRAGAVRAMRRLLAELADEGLAPESATFDLARSMDVAC